MSCIGKYFLPQYLYFIDRENKFFTDMIDLFNFEMYDEISEVNVESRNNKNENFNDATIHRACGQLFNAINFSEKWYLRECDDFRESIISSSLYKKWGKYLHDNNLDIAELLDWRGKINDKTALDFLESEFERKDLQDIGHYSVFYNFPIIVIDTENDKKLFEVIFDDHNNIISFDDAKYGVYKYTHNKNVSSYYGDNYPKQMGVLICDISHLDELIGNLKQGMIKLKQFLEHIFSEKPHLIAYDILFNPDLINPMEYIKES